MKATLIKIKNFFINLFGFIDGLYKLTLSKEKPRVFYGYWHWSLSKLYARIRFKKYPENANKKGKKQGVFAFGEESLIVLSPLELRLLKKRHLIDHPKWYNKIFKKEAYYKVER